MTEKIQEDKGEEDKYICLQIISKEEGISLKSKGKRSRVKSDGNSTKVPSRIQATGGGGESSLQMTYKALFWNIRSVRTQHDFHRVQMLQISQIQTDCIIGNFSRYKSYSEVQKKVGNEICQLQYKWTDLGVCQ